MSKLSVQNFFLIISLFFGMLYVFILPPFQSVDEASHFFRGASIIEGNFADSKYIHGEVGNMLPKGYFELFNEFAPLIKNINEKTSIKEIQHANNIIIDKDYEFINFQNTALYSPICYLGQLPGMYIAKMFKSNPLTIFYAGRISNLIFWCMIVYAILSITPVFKLPILLLACMPMTLSLASSLTSDVVLISFNLLWLVLILNYLFIKEIGYKQIIILTILSFLMGMTKHYVMLIPLIFLIPKVNFKSRIIEFFPIISAVLSILVWNFFISGLYIPLNGSANAQLQWANIIQNPMKYIEILTVSTFLKFPRIVITGIGVLGWQDTPLDFLTYFMYPVMFYIAVASDKSKLTISTSQTFLLSLISVVSYILIATFMYLSWSPVGSPIIYGLNGKYFLPILIPFLLIFKDKLPEIGEKQALIYLFIFLILLSSEFSLVHRFYDLTPNLYYKI